MPGQRAFSNSGTALFFMRSSAVEEERHMAKRRRRYGKRGRAISGSWSTGIVALVVGSGVIWWIVWML
jgi:hypothetical protein